jgi:predicted molibdopterin-dependent oxidoreductase YjgC
MAGKRLNMDKFYKRGPQVNVYVDGRQIVAFKGETIAAALIANNIQAFRTSFGGSARGVFCGMGVCYECLVTVDGIPNLRACQIYVEDGMQIKLQSGLATLSNY